ncbi:hypothetical protein D0962_10010 [Leptolyngbyaceae cyanobacterium CCMR0082]|uniref:Uncharacterized protein n=1 Tax=Adonisia turfae CCMR0082 TaxID=2304604 RepID=A0A6M0S574_9CYAN|nr:hypothetical protein [Adonisia turfae]NEZ63111.1 hypothetical protein [Adonisia turfae CCMR0082]
MIKINTLRGNRLYFLQIIVAMLMVLGLSGEFRLLEEAKAMTNISFGTGATNGAAVTTVGSKPDVNEANIKSNSDRIKGNSTEIENLKKTNDSQLQTFIGILFGAAIISRIADYVISERSQETALKQLRWDFEQEILPELVKESVKEGIQKIEDEYRLIEQEILFMQYELIDLSLSQFEFEKASHLQSENFNESTVIDDRKIFRQVEYNVRAIQILHRMKEHAEGQVDITKDIGTRIAYSLSGILFLLQTLKNPRSSELYNLLSDIEQLVSDDNKDVSYNRVIDKIINLINDRLPAKA